MWREEDQQEECKCSVGWRRTECHYIATPGRTGHWADTQVCVCVADNVLSQVSFTRMGIVYPPNYCRGSSQLGLMVFALCVSEDEGGTAQHHTVYLFIKYFLCLS